MKRSSNGLPECLPRHRRAVVVGLAAVLVTACMAIAAAQEAKPRNDAATRQFAAAAALQNRDQFDLAAEEWTKFLKNFAGDPRADRAQHYLGICHLKNKQYAEAAAAFNHLIATYPKSENLSSAWLHLGLAQYNLAVSGRAELYSQAAETFANVLTKFPQSKEVAQAVFYRGESLYALGKKDEAAALYSQVVEKYAKDALYPEALYALGVTQEELGHAAVAGASYDAYLKQFAGGPHAAEVTLRRGETLFAQRQFEVAEKWFAAAAAKNGFADADVATVRQAATLYELHKYVEAAALYASLPQRFPQSKHGPAAQLAAGKCDYLAGNFARARDRLAKTLASGGATGAEAAHWLARSYLKEQNPAEAMKVADAAIPQAAQTAFAAQLALDRADALYDQPARRHDALAAYAELAQKYPNDPLTPQALYMAAFTALQVGDHAHAIGYGEQFLKQFPDKELAADVGYIAAECDLQLGKYDSAVARYDGLLKQYPQRADVATWQVRRGLALFLQKKFAEVVAALEPLLPSLGSKPPFAEAAYLVGSSQNELKQYEAAGETLSRGLAAEPRGRQAADTLLALSLAERRLNKPAQAKAHLQQLVTQFADSAAIDRAHFRLAEDAYQTGDAATAQAEYKLVIEKFAGSPLVPNALYGLAWVQLGAHDNAGAVATLDTLVANHAASELVPRARYARALAREQLKQFGPALDDVKAFLQSNPAGNEKSDARYVLGLCLVGLNQPAEAAQAFRGILDEDAKYPGSDKVLYELAWAMKSLDQNDEATATFRRLAKDYPSSSLVAESLYHVAEAEYQRGSYAPAATAYYEAMQKAGKTALGEKAAHKLGWAYFRQNLFDKARQSFGYQRATWPQGTLAADAAFMEGESLFKQGKFAEAVSLYKQVDNPAGKDFGVLAALHGAQAQAQLKEWQAALATSVQAAKQFPDSEYVPELLYEQGWAKQNLGQADEALPLYEEVTAKTDREVAARARFMVGEIYFEKKNHAEAVKNFFKAAYGYGYPQWQANAQYEAGRCFEVLGKPEQAVKSYQEVVEKFPDSDKTPLAKARLEALRSAK
ncbi:MAG TPA: tetratricopeptide repeat protein [Pirellulales bacterium]|nr:tetratricopeptide repeat protein [Pirellulales bacterium]